MASDAQIQFKSCRTRGVSSASVSAWHSCFVRLAGDNAQKLGARLRLSR